MRWLMLAVCECIAVMMVGCASRVQMSEPSEYHAAVALSKAWDNKPIKQC